MVDSFCDINGHQYRLWDGNTRECVKCGMVQVLPMNESILYANNMQKKAKDELDLFLSCDDNSIEAVKGVIVILNKYLNFLDVRSLGLFQDKLKVVGVANNMSEVSIACCVLYINKLKNFDKISDVVLSQFDSFIEIFNEEVDAILSSNYEKKATL